MAYKVRAFARRLLYSLKRSYGGPVDIYYQTGETVDWGTGRQTPNTTKYAVRLAVLLPLQDFNKKILAKFIRSEFRYGGLEEYTDREILVDRHDLTVEIGIENWYVIISGTRYQIAKMVDFGDGTAWLISLTEDGGKREAQVDMTVKAQPSVTTTQEVTP